LLANRTRFGTPFSIKSLTPIPKKSMRSSILWRFLIVQVEAQDTKKALGDVLPGIRYQTHAPRHGVSPRAVLF
jgi:hypothetical protein